ncbi:hypothetical protein [Octadecabacter antarcticus]|uniref:hypothetical protein n=1 Tax=Octadecabacter antarcticus TaxID=1217908 RepID=UPI002FDD7FE2
MSEFWTRNHISGCETGLEAQDVAGRQLSFGHRIDARHAAQQACGFQLADVVVQR